MTAALTLEAVCAGYGEKRVLHDVGLQVERGEIVALIGANGAGKSTLLNTILGAVRLSSGRITANGADLGACQTPDIVRQGVALVPERRQLFGEMSVEENLLLGAHLQRGGRAALRAALDAQYQLFPVLAERRRQLARSLSGGEQQMLAIARAQMSRPTLLLLDEPSLGLAPIIVGRIMDLLRGLRDAGITILLVEQNARAALGIAERGYVLETGRVVQHGPSRELLADARVQEAYLGGESGPGGDSLEARIRRIADSDTASRSGHAVASTGRPA